MTSTIDPCDTQRNNLIAAAVGLQQCTKTDGTEVLIPGTDKRILIGGGAYLAKVAGAAAQPRATEQADEQLCPACQGSGEGVMMEGQGPDTYEVPCACPYCKGSGGLLDAYHGLVALLDAEREKYLRLCGKAFWAKREEPAATTASASDILEVARTGDFTVRICFHSAEVCSEFIEGIQGRAPAPSHDAAPLGMRANYETWAADNLPQYFSGHAPTWATVEANVRTETWNAWRAALTQQSAAQAGTERDAWQPIETAPHDEVLLLAYEFDRPGDWRIKVGGYWNGEWEVFGASWTPTRWMPLPNAPIVSDYESRRAAMSAATKQEASA